MARTDLSMARKCWEVVMAHTLIPNDRVEAVAVYCCDGQKIGTIERLMLEKKTGTVAYAARPISTTIRYRGTH
jgi:hypothetical protein